MNSQLICWLGGWIDDRRIADLLIRMMAGCLAKWPICWLDGWIDEWMDCLLICWMDGWIEK